MDIRSPLNWICYPGAMIAHLDTHVQLLGAFGALTISLLADLLTALALGRFWIEVPATIS